MNLNRVIHPDRARNRRTSGCILPKNSEKVTVFGVSAFKTPFVIRKNRWLVNCRSVGHNSPAPVQAH